VELEEDYPGCVVEYAENVGNGVCDGPSYAFEECGWDGGDCRKINDPCSDHIECANSFCSPISSTCKDFDEEYPDCVVEDPQWIGDGICNGPAYASEECGWDGGDCKKINDPCSDNYECGTHFCSNQSSTCVELEDEYPGCIVENLIRIGDGGCDGVPYDSEECGWDGGDCKQINDPCSGHFECRSSFCSPRSSTCVEFEEEYPGCDVEIQYWVGDGKCDGSPYASEECGWDGGDCPSWDYFGQS